MVDFHTVFSFFRMEEKKSMKLLYQFGMIMAVSFLGEVLHELIPLPVPASIYGLVLMLLALMGKVIKLEKVKAAGDFLLDIMPPMFIPAGVGLLTAWTDLKPVVVPVAVITVVTTVFVMGVTGRVSQEVIRRGKRKEALRGEREDQHE
jgi:holin-like protein